MFNKKYFRCFCLTGLYAVAALSYGANFTYDGINRRDPENELERNTIGATGNVFCKEAKTGRQLVTTGFLIDIGQERQNAILITSGHGFRDSSDDEYHSDCIFRPYGSEYVIPIEDIVAGNLAQPNPAVFIKNDWGVGHIPPNENMVGNAIPLSNKTYQELHSLLQAGLGEIKFYGGNLIPDQGEARIQVSDNCSIWQPTPRAILGAGHSLYTNCDSTGSSSGGPVVFESYEGSVEVIGIMFGAIHTVTTVNSILGDNASTMTIKDVENAIDIIPSPETIINIAVPLIPGMREQSLSDLFDGLLGF
jgi:hypothetical protein